MLTVCYGAKGGQGTTTVTAALAIIEASPSLLAIDASGDLPAALGVTPDPSGPDLANVLTGCALMDATALARLAQPFGNGPRVVPTGGPLDAIPAERWQDLGWVLRNDDRHWVVDAGSTLAVAKLATQAQRALLVVSNCYMAIGRARRHPVRPTGIVFVHDRHRALDLGDVATVADAPVVATIRHDPHVGRACDAGLALTLLPNSIRKPLVAMVEAGA